MTDPTSAWALGFIAGAVAGFSFGSRMPRDRDPNWRSSFNHENTNRPSGPPPLRLRRSGDVGSLRPTTPKPGITPAGQGSWLALDGRIVDAYGRTVGYIPRSRGGTSNPPPEAP